MPKIINYKNLEWYIINETDKERLLFLKDSFTNEQILKYFTDKSMVDEFCDVRFSRISSPWFIDSYIREVLNGSFLSVLDKNDLNIMKTVLTLNNETKISEDYVRLITKEEVDKWLPKEILKTKRKYGYWTMTPYGFYGKYAAIFNVKGSKKPGHLGHEYFDDTFAVRPVITLKFDNLKTTMEEELKELIRMIYILSNNKVNDDEWNKYYAKYNSLKSFTEPIDLLLLRNILAKSLLNVEPSFINDIDKHNEYKSLIIKELGNSKKLIMKL